VTTTDSGSRIRTTVRTRSTQKALVMRKPANQRHGNAHPDGATDERLHPKAGGQPDVTEPTTCQGAAMVQHGRR
jgi:hypothetical protein